MGDRGEDRAGAGGQGGLGDLQVISPEEWWWAGWSILSFLALVLNLLFLIVVIKNRKNRDLRSLLTAVLITITVLDILDVLRIIPAIITTLHGYTEFRLVYCSLGVFHTVAVALLLTSLGLYLVWPCRDAPPLYYPESTCSGSLPQKVAIPLVLAVSGLTAGLAPLLPALRSGDLGWGGLLPHSCIDPTRSVNLKDWETEEAGFWPDLYHSLVTGVVVALPLLAIPPALLVAAVRALIRGHCCQVKFKQSAGELLLVFLVTAVHLATIVASVLPRLDSKLADTQLMLDTKLPQVSVLWELGNAALRPALYFLAHPAAWAGLQGLCCSGKRSYGSVSTKEDEVALSPITERVSSL